MSRSSRWITGACLTALVFSCPSCQKNRQVARRLEESYLDELAEDEAALKQAVLALGRARSLASVPQLLDFAGREDELGDLAAVALSLIGLEKVAVYMNAREASGMSAGVDARLRVLDRRAREARPRLLEIALRDPDDRFSATAGEALVRLGVREAMPGIVDALESGDHVVRLRALRLVSRIGPPGRSALPAVLAATAADPELCHSAAHALASVAAKEPGILVPGLEDESANARFTVAMAFERLGLLSEPHATEIAERLFDRDPRVALAAATTLARLGERARAAAPQMARAIRELRHEPPGAEVDDFVRDPRAYLTRALGAMGPVTPELIPALLEVARERTESPDFRSGAIRALGELEPWSPEVLPVLARSVEDPVPHVRHAAVDALGKVNRAEVVPILGAVIDSAADEPGPRSAGFSSLPLAAARALVGLDGALPGLVPCFTALLEDRRAPIRTIALGALSGYGHHAISAVPGIARLLDDREREVRMEAARTLEKLGRHARSAIPDLKRVAQSDPSRSVQRAAARALERVRRRGAS